MRKPDKRKPGRKNSSNWRPSAKIPVIDSFPPVLRFNEAYDRIQALRPLVQSLEIYDEMRLRLLNEGGNLSLFSKMTTHLVTPFTIQGRFVNHNVSLAKPESLRTMMNDVGNHKFFLDCRVAEYRMPVYYLCRIERDYWAAYSLIVEDLYTSPGYGMPDERFVRLMYLGHETWFLRLAQYRKQTAELIEREETMGQSDVNSLLHTMGRHIFRAAWHEDQRPGMMVARQFGLSQFRQAIELAYLALSADLCELRSVISEPIRLFLKEVYSQPAILRFLDLLPGTSGAALNGIQQDTLADFRRLSEAFSHFLGTDVPWGRERSTTPLFKLVFGNFNRLSQVAGLLGDDPVLGCAKEELEAAAAGIIESISHAA